MKKYLISLLALATSIIMQAQVAPSAASQEGSALWLSNQNLGTCQVSGADSDNATLAIAKDELSKNYKGKAVTFQIDPSLNLGEGYQITPTSIKASQAIGILYGAYELIRLQALGDADNMNKTEKPAVKLRILNHWDNLDGSIERGYAGKSIWKWADIKLDKSGKAKSISKNLHDRLITYARANASLGINGSVLNNVNASPKMMTAEYINKVKVIANIFRPYGIRVYLSINFASPMALGYTKTADPLDKKVQQWWQKKAKEIYAAIPDFGGFWSRRTLRDNQDLATTIVPMPKEPICSPMP